MPHRPLRLLQQRRRHARHGGQRRWCGLPCRGGHHRQHGNLQQRERWREAHGRQRYGNQLHRDAQHGLRHRRTGQDCSQHRSLGQLAPQHRRPGASLQPLLISRSQRRRPTGQRRQHISRHAQQRGARPAFRLALAEDRLRHRL